MFIRRDCLQFDAIPFCTFHTRKAVGKVFSRRNSNISRWSLPCTLHRVSGLQVINWREWEHNEAEQSTKSLSHRWLIVTENYNLQTHPVINWRLIALYCCRSFFFVGRLLINDAQLVIACFLSFQHPQVDPLWKHSLHYRERHQKQPRTWRLGDTLFAKINYLNIHPTRLLFSKKFAFFSCRYTIQMQMHLSGIVKPPFECLSRWKLFFSLSPLIIYLLLSMRNMQSVATREV